MILNVAMSSKIIIGIDPGTVVMGYGVISVEGSKVEVLAMGVVALDKFEDHYVRLRLIFEKTLSLIEQYLPDELAIESPFFGKNMQIALKLGRVQGIAMAAALYRDIPIAEYAPRKVKQSITGNGNATKEGVLMMLQQILKITDIPQFLDASDGLAVALCHHLQTHNALPKNKVETSSKIPKSKAKKGNQWGSFVNNNQDRVLNKS